MATLIDDAVASDHESDYSDLSLSSEIPMDRIELPDAEETPVEIAVFSETVQLYVGDADPITIHKSFLLKVPWFETCLRQPMEEGLSNIIKLPEDDPKTFEDFLGFVYLGKAALEKYDVAMIHNSISDKNPRSKWRSVLRLYQLAEKLSYEELQNYLVDQFQDWNSEGAVLGIQHLQRMESELHPKCKLIKYWAAQIAFLLRDVSSSWWAASFSREVAHWAKEGSQLGIKILFLAASYEKPIDPFKRHPCKWHVHNNTRKCLKRATATNESP